MPFTFFTQYLVIPSRILFSPSRETAENMSLASKFKETSMEKFCFLSFLLNLSGKRQLQGAQRSIWQLKLSACEMSLCTEMTLGDTDKRKGKRKETTQDVMPLGWERWQAVAEGEVVVIALLTGLSVNKSIMRGESWNKVWELRKGKTGNAHQQ